MPFARANRIILHYDVTGSGEPLLLIPGLGANLLGWDHQIPVLAQHFQVIAFDSRGADHWAAAPRPYSTQQLAGDVVALLDHLGVERAHVVGYCVGGMIAQELAIASPERIDRLALVSTFARPRRSVFDPWLTLQEEAVERGISLEGFAIGLLPWLFTSTSLTRPDLVERLIGRITANLYRASRQGLLGQTTAIRAHDTLDRLGQITAPTLVLVGAEDILTPVHYAQELAERIPGAQLQIIGRGGHGMVTEYFEEVNEALLAFLES